MTRPTTVLVALLACGIVHAAPAHHSNVSISAWKENGKVVGAVVKVLLRPEGGQTRVRVGLMPTGQNFGFSDYHRAVSSMKAGKLAFQWPEERGLKDGVAVQKTYRVRYGQGNRLKGGERLELVSAWQGGATALGMKTTGSKFHVWGLSRVGIGTPTAYKLPSAS